MRSPIFSPFPPRNSRSLYEHQKDLLKSILAESHKNRNSYRKSEQQNLCKALIGNIKALQLLFNEHCTVSKEAGYLRTSNNFHSF